MMFRGGKFGKKLVIGVDGATLKESELLRRKQTTTLTQVLTDPLPFRFPQEGKAITEKGAMSS